MLTGLGALESPNAPLECGCYRRARTGHRNPQVQPATLAGLGRSGPRSGDTSRLRPGVRDGWAGVGLGGGVQAARGQAPGLALRGAERGRPPGSKFKAPGSGRGALSAPLRSGHFPLAGAPRSLGPGYPRGPPRPPPRPAPPGVPSPAPVPRGLRARGSCARSRAHRLRPGEEGAGARPGCGGPSPGSPALPNSAAPARGPPLGVPLCAPRQLRPRPRGGRHPRAGVQRRLAGRGSPHQALPPGSPPRPGNFRPEPTHHPKNSPGENESGGGDVPWRCCEEARPAPERARSVPGEGGPEAAGGGGEGGRAGEGASARGRGRAVPAPPARRTLPSARLPRPRAPPVPQASGRRERGCGGSIPSPARARGGRASGRGGGGS